MADALNKVKCFIVGFTGETGKELVKECFKSDKFSKVLLLGRRKVDLPAEMNEKCEQQIIDFEDLDASKDLLSDVDVGYCCLGTTRGKAGKDGFIKVDKDYTMGVAKLAQRSGVKQFHYVSSQGANKNSWFLYPKVKGEVEHELSELGFNRLFIYRPAMLICNREERRMSEKFFRCIIAPVSWVSPTSVATPTTMLAQAMVNCTTGRDTEPSSSILVNKDIYAAADGKYETDG